MGRVRVKVRIRVTDGEGDHGDDHRDELVRGALEAVEVCEVA